MYSIKKRLHLLRPSRLRRIAEDIPNYYSLKTPAYLLNRYRSLELGSDGELPEGNLYKILFIGDNSFAENYGEKQTQLLAEKGYDYPLAKVRPLLKQSDIVICNLETPITNIKSSPYQKIKSYVHWTHIEKAPEALKRNNIVVFSLANNHTFDYGTPGLRQTLETLERHDMKWFGAGMNEKEASKPLIKTLQIGERKLKIAVIGVLERYKEYETVYNYYAKADKGGCYVLERQTLRKQIQELKKSDPETYVIVFPHWGFDYKWKGFHQTSNAHRMIKYGADLVIGHGAHGIQEIEKYKDRWILYSIGNFVFLSEGRHEELGYPPYSFAVQLLLANNRGKLRKWARLYPIHSDNKQTDFQPRPLTDDESNDFINKILGKSPMLPSEVRFITKGKDECGIYLQFQID